MAIRHKAVRVFAPAKINLFLHVTGKRPDGYHDLQSLVAFADAGDALTFEPSSEFTLSLGGPFGAGLLGESDNLVLRAARRLAAQLDRHDGALISLTKNLPVASGIGGGSADAAATLRGLLDLWAREEEERPFAALAAELGSDVPVCLKSQTAWMEGRGEAVTPLSALPAMSIVLVNPGVSIATADVFRRLAIEHRGRLDRPDAPFGSPEELVAYLRTTRNDLEESACLIAPVIRTVLERLSEQGAMLARMSGSGATCFGLFETDKQAAAAAERLRAAEPGWWVHSGGFASAGIARPQVVA